VGGETIYIDTEGSFMVERAHQIASYVAKHLTSLSERMKSQPHMESLKQFASRSQGDLVMSFLEGIHVMRVHDHTEQLAAVANLSALIKQHPKGTRFLPLLNRKCVDTIIVCSPVTMFSFL
jgi:RAD51-like protein 2